MTKKTTYYINNVLVDADTFYETDFSDLEIELLFQGVLIKKGENDYRIFMEDETMKYDNNFYRGFNGRKKNTKFGGRFNWKSKKNKKEKKSNTTYNPYSSSWYYDDEAEDFYYDYARANVDMNKKSLYIAYGSNLNKAQMITRCPHAVAKYTGLLNGWELFYAGSKTGNYATIRKCEGKAVPVAVWEIDGLDEYYLDIYEGYPTFYFKDTIKFMTAEGEKEAMVYIMRLDAEEGIPSVYYEKTVRQGYKDFGFDEKYLNQSIEDTINRVINKAIAN